LGIALALAVLYRYGPSREKPQWRWITWGSGVAAVSWLVVSIHAENFGSYNKTYGSLGALALPQRPLAGLDQLKNPNAPAVKRKAEEDWGKERWR
jgi:hypothetical protein